MFRHGRRIPIGLRSAGTTRKGLKVTVEVVDKLYQTGRKYAEGFKANIPILFDCHLPKWDYTAVPSPAMA